MSKKSLIVHLISHRIVSVFLLVHCVIEVLDWCGGVHLWWWNGGVKELEKTILLFEKILGLWMLVSFRKILGFYSEDNIIYLLCDWKSILPLETSNELQSLLKLKNRSCYQANILNKFRDFLKVGMLFQAWHLYKVSPEHPPHTSQHPGPPVIVNLMLRFWFNLFSIVTVHRFSVTPNWFRLKLASLKYTSSVCHKKYLIWAQSVIWSFNCVQFHNC